MRITVLSFFLLVVTTVTAQTPLTGMPGTPLQQSIEKLNKKWSLSKYIGASTTFGFLNHGNASVFSVPVGLQLNRRLNNNLYAFAGVSVAPSYINFNGSFLNNDVKVMQQSLGRYNQFATFTRAELGLMYVNEQKTFSISGSFGVQQGVSPFYPVRSVNTIRPNQLYNPQR
jgi:hypothetical protein